MGANGDSGEGYDPVSGLVFDAWVFGGAPGGRLLHAVKRMRSSLPGAHVVVGLCSVRGSNGLRATNRLFEPAAEPDVCTACARRFAAFHVEHIPGWDRTCATCGEAKNVAFFHTDRRTKDGISKSCIECTDAARRAVADAERTLRTAVEREEALARATRNRDARLAALRQYQDSSLLPTFRCTAGHVLEPVPSVSAPTGFGRFGDVAWPDESWSCPCGVVPCATVEAVGDEGVDWTAVLAAAAAVRTLLDAASPAPVNVCAGASS